MNSFLKRYKIILKTDGAVFVGSGKSIKANEYIEFKDRILVPEQEKMYTYLCARGLGREFERIEANSGQRLAKWMEDCKIKRDEYKNFGGYYIEKNGEDIKGVREIMTCMKDPFGFPYIPGSSLKGALRTALLWCSINDRHDSLSVERASVSEIRFANAKENKKTYQGIIERIEQDEFNTLHRSNKRSDAVNDSLSCIRISDSKPLNPDCLAVCPKKDYDINGYANSQTVIHRECIKPDTEIEFDMTIDTAQSQYTDEYLINAVKLFFKHYCSVVDEKFGDKTPYKDGQYIYIGGGAGFVSKTVMYGLFKGDRAVRAVQDVFQRTMLPKIYRMHGHSRDMEYGVSPHMIKCTKYKGYEYYMGKCHIDIIEV